MKYFLLPVLLSVTLILPAAEKKETAPAEQKPAPKKEKPVLQVLSEDSGRVYRKIKRKMVRAFDFSGEHGIRTSLEAAKSDRMEKARSAGEFMAKHFAGKRVALLLFGTEKSENNKSYTEAFTKAAAGKIELVIISVDAGKGGLPLPDDEPSVDALNRALLQSIAKGADALVNLAGLPSRNSHCRKLIFWQWSNNDPRVYLADSPDPLLLKKSLFPCPFAAVAVPRLLTEDELAEAADFNARYIVLTEKNLDTSGIFHGK